MSAPKSEIVDAKEDKEQEKDKGLWRDLVAFWFLALCTGFGYTVMLSAAHDILGQFQKPRPGKNWTSVGEGMRECHELSAGTVLIADVVPAFIAKIVMPFLPFWVNLRIAVAIALSISGFLTVALANTAWIAFLGIVFTSTSRGVGESTCIGYMASYNKNVVSTHSSGAGASGVIVSITYVGLTSLGLTPRTTLLLMVSVPIIEAFMFWVLLRKPLEEVDVMEKKAAVVLGEKQLENFMEKLLYILELLNYMVPLAIVYFFNYFINSGLYELVYFTDSFLTHAEQFRWYQATFNVFGFIARSSVNLVKIKRIWVLSILQALNGLFFLMDAIYHFIPSVWIVFGLIVWEALIAGGAYVNSYYRIATEVPLSRRNYALAVLAQAGSYGIIPAGLVAMPIHNAICKLPAFKR